MSDFLKNLKDAVEEGKFNSDAAKKINEIDERADDFAEMKTVDQMDDSLTEKAVESGIKTVSEEEVVKLNSEYEEKMKVRAREEIMLASIATLINTDEAIQNEIGVFKLFIDGLKEDFDKEDESTKELYVKIEEVEKKYNIVN